MEEDAVCSCGYIPSEIETEILSSLPAASLVRFKCVQKSWSSLFQDLSFIAQFVSRQKNNVFLFSTSSDQSLYCKNFERGNINPNAVDCLMPGRGKFRFIVGSINGLVCLTNFCYWNAWNVRNDGDSIYIWNPSTRKIKVIPKPYYYRYNDNIEAETVLGFGFCSGINDYKVVKITGSNRLNGSPPSMVEVYTMSTNSWKIISIANVSFNWFLLNSSSQPHVFINGASHWLARPSNSTHRRFIMSFKFDEEVFVEIKLPRHYIDDNGRFSCPVNIAEYRNLLSLTIEPVKDTLEIWVMHHYGVADSWVRLFSIHSRKLYVKGFDLTNLEDENDNLFLVDKVESRLVCYNPKTKQITKDRGLALPVWHFTSFKPSLVSLPGEISVDLVKF